MEPTGLLVPGKNTDNDEYTFLVVAFSNVMKKAMESDLTEVMNITFKMSEEEKAFALFNKVDKYDQNTQLYLVVDHGLKELVSYLPSTKKELSLRLSKDGCSPFHSAVHRHNIKIINWFFNNH